MTEWLRSLRRDARGAGEGPPGDARRVDEHVRRRVFDPEVGRRRRLRQRGLVLALAGVCLAGTAAAVVGEGGWLDMVRLRREIDALDGEIARREAAVERLQRDVERLQRDPVARERIARELLGMVRPGEIQFLLPKDDRPVWDAREAKPDPAPGRP